MIPAATSDAPRCYLVPELLEKLQMTRSAFYTLKRAGALPFVQELRPRLGLHPRFRADLVDAYLRGEWHGLAPARPRLLTKGRSR